MNINSSDSSSSLIRLNVGGKKLCTYINTLTQREPNSMLAAMFSTGNRDALCKDEEGYVFIDRDGEYFTYILNYLRDGDVPTLQDSSKYSQLLNEAHYFELEGLTFLLNNKKKELDTDLTRQEIIKSLRDKSPPQLTGVNLYGLDLSGLELSGINFTRACIRNVCFAGACLSGSNFDHVDAMGADFTNVTLGRTSFKMANLQGANFNNANMVKHSSFQEANLQGANFSNANMVEPCHFEKANLQGANFSNANMKKGCWFSEANLRGANFNSASLGACRFEKAGLQGANFNYAKLGSSWFNDANLEGASAVGVECDRGIPFWRCRSPPDLH